MRGSGRVRHNPNMKDSGKVVVWLALAAFWVSASGVTASPLADRSHGLIVKGFQGEVGTTQNHQPLLISRRCPFAVISRAKRRMKLPSSARAVGCRMVKQGANRFWKVIFRVGNRQISVKMRARR